MAGMGEHRGHRTTAFDEDTGSLFLFRGAKTLRLTAGREPSARVKSTSGRWRFDRGSQFDFSRAAAWVERFPSEEGRSAAPEAHESWCLERFLRLVPEELLARLVEYRENSFVLYSFFARIGEPALELADSNPAIAFLIANAYAFAGPVQREMRRSRRLVRRRRRDVLAELGFPATVRLLAKIPPQSLTIERLLSLRRTLARPIPRGLSHLPRLNAAALDLANANLLPHCGYRLVMDVCLDPRHDEVGPQWLAAMVSTVGQLRERGLRMQFRNTEELEEVFRTLSEEASTPRVSPQLLPPGPFPDVPGTIEHLATTHALKAEGKEMHHCSGSPPYVARAWTGLVAFYRLLEPLRCTVELCREGGRWHVGEVGGRRNREATGPARDRAVAWLRSFQPEIPPEKRRQLAGELRGGHRRAHRIPNAPMPRTRGDCRDGARPCPYVRCRHHLYLNINPETGAIRFNFRGLEVWELEDTCSLDVADRDGLSREQVAEVINRPVTSIRMVEVMGLHQLRERLEQDCADTRERRSVVDAAEHQMSGSALPTVNRSSPSTQGRTRDE